MSRPDPPPSPWDQRYAGEAYLYGTDPNDFLESEAHRLPEGGRVLCLGAGEGRNAVFLAARGFRVVAVDRSSVGLDKARRLAAERDVVLETVTADLTDLRIEPGGWDGVISIWCHLPSEVRREVHRRVVEGLRPRGIFLLEAYTPRQLEMETGGPRDRDLLVTVEDLRADVPALEILTLEERLREVREGRRHTGPAQVVQLIARKQTSGE